MLARLTIASATPARLTGLRNSMRNPRLGSTSAGGVLSLSMLDLGGLGFCLRLAGDLDQRILIQAMFLAIVAQGHRSVPPSPVHRIDIGVKEYLIEVPDENCEGRQHRLVEVDRRRDVEPPARQMIAHAHLGPQHP